MTFILIGFALGPAHGQERTQKSDRPLIADVVTERVETVYRFESDGTGTAVYEMRARVETPLGREQVSQVKAQFDASTSNVRFDYLRTLKPDGRVVAARTEDAHDVALGATTEGAQALSDTKAKVLTTPDVDVGDRVEWRITVNIDRPDPRGEFWATHSANSVFTESEVVVLNIPAEQPVALRIIPDGHGVETKDGRTIHRWTLTHPGPAEASWRSAPAVFAVSSFATWEQFGDWFRGLLSTASKSTPEIEALAQRLIAGKETSRARAEAIYDYVARSVRYASLTFGGHGYRPHAIADVLKNSYGDCKDKYALLSALLRVAGIVAEPVLVEAGRDLREPDVPLPSEFNHIIAAVKLDGETAYLDPTEPAAAFGVLAPGLRGKNGLLVQQDRVRIVKVNADSPLPQFVHARVVGSISGTGALEATSRLEVRGDLELVYRRIFHRTNEDVTHGFTQFMAQQQVRGAEAKNVSPGDPADLAKPFVVEYQVSKDLYINPLESEVDVNMPRMLHAMTLAALSSPTSDDKVEGDVSDYDLRQGFATPTDITETIELALPPSHRLALPLPVRVANDAASYTSEYKEGSGRLIATRTLKLKPEAFNETRRAGLASLRKIVERDQDQTLHLSRTGKPLAGDLLGAMTADQLNAMGAAALDDSKFDAALPVLLKATEKDPHHGFAWNNLGRAHLGLKRWAEAERAFKKQIEINPLDEYSYANLGLCYWGQKRYEEALASLRKQLEINPFDSTVYSSMGSIYEEQHRLPEAVKAFEQGLQAKKDDPLLHQQLVRVLSLMGRTKEATEHLEKLAALQGIKLTPAQRQMLAQASVQSDSPVAPPMGQKITASGKALDQLLASAKAEARQVIARLTPLTAADRSFERVPDMARLAVSLDRIGQALALKGDRGVARLALKTALDISLDRDVALRLSELEDADGKREEAARYYAWASSGGVKAATAPPHLANFLTNSFPDRTSKQNYLAKLMFGFVEARRVRQIAWPRGLVLKDSSDVVVRMLIDDKGAVIGAIAVRGEGPARDGAVDAARQLKFTPLVYDGAGIRHTRTLWVRYNHSGTIEAMWGFGPDPVGECNSGLAAISKAKPEAQSKRN